MAFTVTSVAQAREMVERARENMAKLREKAETAIGTGIQIAEVSGTSFAFGYANARWGHNGELTIGGVPVDLGAAIMLHGTAFMGGFGKYEEHGHNLGTGALAATAYRTGAQIGASSANKSHAQGAPPPWLQQQPQPWALPQGAQQPAASPQAPLPQHAMPNPLPGG